MGVGGQRHAPAAIPPRKTRYPLYRRLSGPQDRSGRMRKITPPPGTDPRSVKPVASRNTDWAIPAHSFTLHKLHKQLYVWTRKLYTLLSLTRIMWKGRSCDIRTRYLTCSHSFNISVRLTAGNTVTWFDAWIVQTIWIWSNPFSSLLDTEWGRRLENNHSSFNAGISFISAGLLWQPVNIYICQLILKWNK